MTSVRDIYPIVQRQYPSLIPEIRLKEFPSLLLSEVAALHLKDEQRMMADQGLVELILAGAAEGVKRIVQIGYIEYLQDHMGNGELDEERVKKALGSRALAAWNETSANRDRKASKTVQARLVRKPKRYEQLPCDLILVVDRQEEYYREIWREGMPYYDQFMNSWKEPKPTFVSRKKGRCLKCETETVVRGVQNLCIGYTETTKYSDKNFNYYFYTYKCEKCELGWTEYRAKSTWSDTTYP